MIPSWLISLLAAIPTLLLIWGSIALVLMTAGLGVLAVYYLPLPRPVVLMALLRTVAELAWMTAGSIAAAVASLVWTGRLRAMDAYDKKDFTGKGIPREDWAAFLDELAGVLWEMRTSGRREP